MKAFVTGVDRKLGHDVMDELAKREYGVIGSRLDKSIKACGK